MADTSSRAARFERERRRRKIIILVLLLLLLLGLGYTAYYYSVNRRLPSLAAPAPEELVQPPDYLFSITGEGAEKLNYPLGVGYRDGRLYVIDFEARVIRVFDRDGKFLFKFADIGGETLQNPVHLAIDDQDQVWVTDRRLRGLYVFDRDGKFVREFDPEGDPGYEWTPLAIGFSDEGHILVSDVFETTGHRIHIFDREGKRVALFGETHQALGDQEEPGKFFFPNGITGVAGEVFVSDSDNRRVQVFDLTGKFLRFVRTSGLPRGIAIDDKDRLYVADALAHQADIYTPEGEKLVTFGEQGFGPGQFRFPNDIALDDDGTRIYVTDRSNNQVQVWGWPVAEIPDVIVPRSWWQWALCFLPLLFLLWPLLRRRVRFAVTPDFVDAMIAEDKLDEMDTTRLVWFAPEDEHPIYEGRVEDGIDLADLIRPVPHSESDAAEIRDRLEVDEATSIILAIARREKRLCTTNDELRKLALLLSIDAYDTQEFSQRYTRRRE